MTPIQPIVQYGGQKDKTSLHHAKFEDVCWEFWPVQLKILFLKLKMYNYLKFKDKNAH